MTLKEHLQRTLIRLGLIIIKALVWIKPRILNIAEILGWPLMIFGRLIIFLLVPVYRIIRNLRKRAEVVYRPAKNRLMYYLANKYTIHVAAALIIIMVLSFNLQVGQVRAENFGETSLMYSLVKNSDDQLIEEEISPEDLVASQPVDYQGGGVLTSLTYGLIPENITPSQSSSTDIGLSGDGSQQNQTSVAPREETISYKVQGGDTLSGVANKFNISLNTLLWANGLSVRGSIKPGDDLVILPVTGVQYTVARGDTITKIANNLGAKNDDIIAFNHLEGNAGLTAGRKIIVPGGSVRAAAPSTTHNTSVGQVFTPPSTRQPIISGSKTGTGTMKWPAEMHVITQYFGWKHTGVDLDCGFTNDNHASDDGIVQFAGWKNGYGYAVEINHGNSLVTRYGHHAKLYVQKGDVVKKGQALGLCGTTGHSTGTHLHFEVMLNGKFQNPLEYIR